MSLCHWAHVFHVSSRVCERCTCRYRVSGCSSPRAGSENMHVASSAPLGPDGRPGSANSAASLVSRSSYCTSYNLQRKRRTAAPFFIPARPHSPGSCHVACQPTLRATLAHAARRSPTPRRPTPTTPSGCASASAVPSTTRWSRWRGWWAAWLRAGRKERAATGGRTSPTATACSHKCAGTGLAASPTRWDAVAKHCGRCEARAARASPRRSPACLQRQPATLHPAPAQVMQSGLDGQSVVAMLCTVSLSSSAITASKNSL